MIQILLFAHLKEAVGQEVMSWQETPIQVSELKKKLKHQYEGLSSLDDCMVAVNEQYAEEDTEIHDGDIVAFIPPVSGG